VATTSRPGDPGVGESRIEELLREEPYRFEFFQAVRLLERITARREPVGRFVNPANEVVRFAAHPSIQFPASQIQELQWSGEGPPRMSVTFMGLTGPLGVLPLAYTQLVRERVQQRDTTLRDFLDIFNHRIISLFYQAWEKYRFPIAYERREQDRFSFYLLALIGLGTRGLQNRQAVHDESLLYYVGLLAQRPRSALALQLVLSDYFDAPVEIEQFAGAWHRLDRETQSCLEQGNSYSEQLGIGTVVGDEVWDQQSGVRIKLGPLRLSQYLDFLPNGTAYEPLRALVRFFSGTEFDFEVQLILKREEVPRCELGSEGEASPQLGWVTWMKSAPFPRDPCDAVLKL
jgi:type VI secretion system protein ImpH